MTEPTFDRGANRLGALALRLADRMTVAVTADGVRSLSAATALSALDRFLDAPSIDTVRQVLGLTSSGAVRLIDGLVADGLVSRRSGADGRVTVIVLTARGRRAAAAAVASRAAVLAEARAPLSIGERQIFDPIIDKMLVALVQGPRPGPAMCRLCDTAACGAERGRPCPITFSALGPQPGDAGPDGL